MLTFAHPSVNPSLVAWMGALAGPLVARWSSEPGHAGAGPQALDTAPAPEGAAAAGAPRWEADEPAGAPSCHYWPCERLDAFILQMAAHGHCVNAAMMLGHRPYAQWQLAQAQEVPDPALNALAAQLQAYFDAPPAAAAQVAASADARLS